MITRTERVANLPAPDQTSTPKRWMITISTLTRTYLVRFLREMWRSSVIREDKGLIEIQPNSERPRPGKACQSARKPSRE